MVVRADLTAAELDRLFRALADATRRDIVARVLAGEPTSISGLAAVQKHVAVLQAAGLVSKERRGRECLVQGNPGRLEQASELLARLEDLWRARFSRIDALFTDSFPQE